MDSRCEPFHTALLLRQLAGLHVVGEMVPGRLEVHVDDVPGGFDLDADEWLEWWRQLLDAYRAGLPLFPDRGASPALVSIIERLYVVHRSVLDRLEEGRAHLSIGTLETACRDIMKRGQLGTERQVAICVLAVNDPFPLTADGLMLLPRRTLNALTPVQCRDLIVAEFGSL